MANHPGIEDPICEKDKMRIFAERAKRSAWVVSTRGMYRIKTD